VKQVRILVADDHEVSRRGIRELLEAHAGWEVCGEAVTGKQAVENAKRLKPNVVVMDITLPELNGLDATREILKALPQTEVLIFTLHDSEELLHEILGAGARGLVLKSDDGRELVAAVGALCEHRPFFSAKASELILKDSGTKSTRSRGSASYSAFLTPRETEIVSLLVSGKSNKEISTILNISTNTVETHRSHILQKLNLHSITDLIHWAIGQGLVSLQDREPRK
jgi:DNA-binding NarL/FixJ family response regulator